WMLWVLGPIFFLEYLIVFYLLIWKLNLKTPGRDNIEFKLFTKKDFINKKEKLIQDQIEYSKIVTDENIKHEKPEDIQKSIQLINFYGGFENITEVGACISRLRISVLDKEKVKKDAIKNLGAAGIVETNDQVQSVFGAKAMVYARIINNIKNK
uniref:glucose PTS transporter subunit EIIB n=1 Tax=Mycoplasmopsis cricetuli TaxID=171283 RepID=UPI00056C378D